MSFALLLGLAILCVHREAAAERAVVVDVTSGTPFAADDLVDAVRVRVAPEGPAVELRVSSIEGGVRIETRRGLREVALGELTGPAAARMVALAASDLLLEDLASAPVLPEQRAATVATLGVLGAASRWDGTIGNLVLDGSIARGSWLAALELGGGRAVGGDLDLTTAILRIGGGYRTGAVELRVGATLAPLVIDTGAGDRTVLAGGGASARLRAPVSPRVRLILAIGLDVFATRTIYRIDSMTAMTTPHVAPWLAAGLEVAP